MKTNMWLTLNCGAYQRASGDFYSLLNSQVPSCEKLEAAKKYLRERDLYVLDQKVTRIPPKHTETLLDRWRATRRKAAA